MGRNQKVVVVILTLLTAAVASFIYLLATTEPANPIVLEEKVKPKPSIIAEATNNTSEESKDVVEKERTNSKDDQENTAAVEPVTYEYEAVMKGDLKTRSNVPKDFDKLVTLNNFSFETTDEPYIYRLLFKEDGIITPVYDHLIAPNEANTQLPSLSLTDSKDIVFSSWVHSSAGAPESQRILVNYRTKDAIRVITFSQMLGDVSVRIDYNDTSAIFHLDIRNYCNEDTFGTMYMTKGIIHEEKEQTVSFPPKRIVCFTNMSLPKTTPIPEIQFQSATKDFSTVYFALVGRRYDTDNSSVIWTENFAYDTATQTLTHVNSNPTNVIIFQ